MKTYCFIFHLYQLDFHVRSVFSGRFGTWLYVLEAMRAVNFHDLELHVRAGSCDVFSKLIGAKGRDVLYCGDHIFGDILKSKKIRGWRTFLIVPEMTHELYVWSARRELHQRLQTLEARLNDAYLHMDSSSTTAPDTRHILAEIQVCVTNNVCTSGGATNFHWGGGYSPGGLGTQVPRWGPGRNPTREFG